jgi:hypothetical protein
MLESDRAGSTRAAISVSDASVAVRFVLSIAPFARTQIDFPSALVANCETARRQRLAVSGSSGALSELAKPTGLKRS